MSLSNRRALLAALKGFDTDIKGVFRTLSNRIGARLVGAARTDGKIARRDLKAVQADVRLMIQRTFVGPDGRSAYAADDRTPLSPFAQTLNKWAVQVTAQIVSKHADMMRTSLPADVAAWLARGRRFVAEQVTTPDAFEGYSAMWDWEDPRGLQLSDRIWNVSLETQRRVDALIADGVRRGRSAVAIARELERFLLPGRAALRTTRPYGQDVSFYAMRLARTEITRQAGQVFIAAARMNPFVEAIVWNVSGSHPKPDECDTLAAGSPYPVDNVPSYPAHPLCLCYLTTVMQPVGEVVDELRAMMEAGETPYVTPFDLRGFLEQLLGPLLAGLALRELATV